ncbi:MAG: hypothetical protein AAF591_18300 [Verrucomicrobiota bacterium]
MRSREDIQAQLNGKVHWDAKDWEVREWLKSKHGIEGVEADEMIREGERVRVISIRKRSLVRGVASLVVGVPLIVAAWAGFESEGRRTTRWAIIVAIAGLGCFAYAGKNFIQLVSGRSDVAIDAE